MAGAICGAFAGDRAIPSSWVGTVGIHTDDSVGAMAGSLVAVLHAWSRRGLNLTKILSRPIPGRFEEYRFMIEFSGATPKKEVVDALARLRKLTDFLAVIGSYPVRKI